MYAPSLENTGSDGTSTNVNMFEESGFQCRVSPPSMDILLTIEYWALKKASFIHDILSVVCASGLALGLPSPTPRAPLDGTLATLPENFRGHTTPCTIKMALDDIGRDIRVTQLRCPSHKTWSLTVNTARGAADHRTLVVVLASVAARLLFMMLEDVSESR